jgi:glutamate racemase
MTGPIRFAKSAPRLLIFDSGLGGLSVLRALREAVPEAAVSYIADDAGFPYGRLPPDVLTARVSQIIGGAIETVAPDAVVVACNTASTIALAHLRACFPLPFVGTVPAIKPAAAISQSRLVSVLATPGTVTRDYTRGLIAQHGQECTFTLVGAERLAGLAEQHMAGEPVPDEAIAGEIAPCFVERGGLRTDVVVLGCTHYPLLIEQLSRLAPWPVTWLDPAPAIARRTANVLAEAGFMVGVGAHRPAGGISFTSDAAPPPATLALLAHYGLTLASVPFTDALTP